MSDVYAITGHRPDKLGGHSKENHAKLVAFATRLFLKIKPKRLYIGMALGWDMACAEAAHNLNIPYVACIPVRGQFQRWPEESQKLWKQLVNTADMLVICHMGEYEPFVMHKRNHFMVDSAAKVISLWNGDHTGGTASCVNYALKQHKSVLNAWLMFTGVHDDLIDLSLGGNHGGESKGSSGSGDQGAK